MPPPGALLQFNDIIPNGAERIMRLVEQEHEHRLKHENSILHATIKEKRRGHWIGCELGISCISAAVYTSHIQSHWAVSVALVGLPIAALAQEFVRTTRKS